MLAPILKMKGTPCLLHGCGAGEGAVGKGEEEKVNFSLST